MSSKDVRIVSFVVKQPCKADSLLVDGFSTPDRSPRLRSPSLGKMKAMKVLAG